MPSILVFPVNVDPSTATLVLLLSFPAIKIIFPLPLLALIEEFAIWIDFPSSNFILFVFEGSFDAATKLAPSDVVKVTLPSPVMFALFKSIPFAIILMSEAEILPFNPLFIEIILYVLSLNWGSFNNSCNAFLSIPFVSLKKEWYFVYKSWVVSIKAPDVSIDPPFIIIPLGFDMIIIPFSPFIKPAKFDMPFNTLFNTA